VEQFGNTGMWLTHVTSPQVNDNAVHDAVYTGIMIISGSGGLVDGNTVSNVGVVGYEANDMNSYGIALSDTGGPPTSGVVVTHNTVDNVPQWHGIDTHGGRGLIISNNDIHHCNRAIFITSSANGGAQDVTIDSNLMDTPTPRIDVIDTYPYNEVGISVFSGTNVNGDDNSFDGWPSGNHIQVSGGSGVVFTNNHITNPT
jgi:hypothetical protein